jgi:hypothetical protein
MADRGLPVASVRTCCGEPLTEDKVTRSQRNCALPRDSRPVGLSGFLQELAKPDQKALAFMHAGRSFDDVRSPPDFAFLLEHSGEHFRRGDVSGTRHFTENPFGLGLLPGSLQDPCVQHRVLRCALPAYGKKCFCLASIGMDLPQAVKGGLLQRVCAQNGQITNRKPLRLGVKPPRCFRQEKAKRQCG